MSILNLPKEIYSLFGLDPREQSYLRATCKKLREKIPDNAEKYRELYPNTFKLYTKSCKDGYPSLVVSYYRIYQESPYFAHGFHDFCEMGHYHLVKLFWDRFIHDKQLRMDCATRAVYNGHIAIVQYLHLLGPIDFELLFKRACVHSNNTVFIEWYISIGGKRIRKDTMEFCKAHGASMRLLSLVSTISGIFP